MELALLPPPNSAWKRIRRQMYTSAQSKLDLSLPCRGSELHCGCTIVTNRLARLLNIAIADSHDPADPAILALVNRKRSAFMAVNGRSEIPILPTSLSCSLPTKRADAVVRSL